MRWKEQKVPYYHHRFDPSYFKGWRGWLILVLNGARAWLERHVEYRVMMYVLRRQAMDSDTVRAFQHRWDEEGMEGNYRRHTTSVIGLFADDKVGFKKYDQGRKNGPDPEDPVSGSLDKYTRSEKAKLYAATRDESNVQEVDAQPVPESEGVGYVPTNNQRTARREAW